MLGNYQREGETSMALEEVWKWLQCTTRSQYQTRIPMPPSDQLGQWCLKINISSVSSFQLDFLFRVSLHQFSTHHSLIIADQGGQCGPPGEGVSGWPIRGKSVRMAHQGKECQGGLPGEGVSGWPTRRRSVRVAHQGKECQGDAAGEGMSGWCTRGGNVRVVHQGKECQGDPPGKECQGGPPGEGVSGWSIRGRSVRVVHQGKECQGGHHVTCNWV